MGIGLLICLLSSLCHTHRARLLPKNNNGYLITNRAKDRRCKHGSGPRATMRLNWAKVLTLTDEQRNNITQNNWCSLTYCSTLNTIARWLTFFYR